MPNKVTYEDNGFNNFLSRKKIITSDTEFVGSIRRPQVTGENVQTNIPESQLLKGVLGIPKTTPVARASGTAADNSGLRVSAWISDAIDKTRVTMAICEVVCYQDSVSASNIVPYGSDTIANGHKCLAWYDYYANQNPSSVQQGDAKYPPNKALTYNFHVQNNTGDSHLYIFDVRWRYWAEREE